MGVAMINTDGSYSEQHGSYGAIIRDSLGEVIGACAGSVEPSSITLHEVQGVENGFKLAISKGIRHAMVGSDSKNAVAFINKTSEPPWQLLHTLRRIERMRQSF